MNKAQAAAYVQSQAACALIELAAMQAANALTPSTFHDKPHKPEDFMALQEKYSLHHNAVHHYLFVISED